MTRLPRALMLFCAAQVAECRILDVVNEYCARIHPVKISSVVKPQCAQGHDAEEGNDRLDGSLDNMTELYYLAAEKLENFLLFYFPCLDGLDFSA